MSASASEGGSFSYLVFKGNHSGLITNALARRTWWASSDPRLAKGSVPARIGGLPPEGGKPEQDTPGKHKERIRKEVSGTTKRERERGERESGDGRSGHWGLPPPSHPIPTSRIHAPPSPRRRRETFAS